MAGGDVEILTISGEQVCAITLDPELTAKHVMSDLAERLGVPTSHQSLVSEGQVLPPSAPLVQQGVSSGGTLVHVVRAPHPHLLDLKTFAFEAGNHVDLRFLLRASANPNQCLSGSDVSPLYSAIRRGPDACVLALLEARADLQQEGSFGDFPLLVAACLGHCSTVKLLLEARADAQQRDSAALRIAIRTGRDTCVSPLLEARADLQHEDSTGDFALLCGARTGRTSCIKMLLDSRADPQQRGSKGEFPLLAAAETGSVASVGLLLEARADPLQQESRTDGSASLVESLRGSDWNLRVLLEARVHPGQQGSTGEFPLLIAARLGRVSCVSLLLEARADPQQRNSKDEDPLLVARLHGKDAVVQLLEEWGSTSRS